MENFKTIGVVLTGAISGIVGALYGGWSGFLTTLLIFNFLDVLTGVLVARSNGEIDSREFLKGIYRKIVMWAVVAVCYRVDMHLPIVFSLMTTVTGSFIFGEAISIVENAGKLGVETEFLSKYFNQVKDKENDKLNNEIKEGDNDDKPEV